MSHPPALSRAGTTPVHNDKACPMASGLTPRPVVERFHAIEDISPGQIPVFEYSLPDVFIFKLTEKCFGHSIIPAVATPLHTLGQIIGPTDPLQVVATVLAALLWVHDNLAVGSSTADGLFQRFE